MKKSEALLRSILLSAFVVALSIEQTSAASVGFAVSPGTTITNDFSGTLSIIITNLPAIGQQVFVQMWTDFNGDGVIETNDYLLRAFAINEGQAPTIGGIRNINVPGDEDGVSNSSVLFKLPLPGLDTVLGHSSGRFILRVTATNFTAVSVPFTVFQKSYPQSISGNVKRSDTQAALTNAIVFLAPQNGSPITTTNTDLSGNFTLYAPPGNYQLISLANGFYSDMSVGQVSLAANQALVGQNISLVPGAVKITTSITNLSKGSGVGGLFVQAKSTNNLFAGGFTDTNGIVVLSVNANNQWQIKPEDLLLAQHNLVGDQNSSNLYVTANTTINLAYNKPTALVYGTVEDNLSNPIAGVEITGSDQPNNVFDALGGTLGTNGVYAVGVFAGNWSIQPDSSSLAALNLSGGNGTNVNLVDGQALQVNFTVQAVTAHLTGQVRDDHNNPIANFPLVVQPYPFTNSNGGNSMYPMTDGSGNYDAGVAAGTWNIALECVHAQAAGFVDYSAYNFTIGNNSTQMNNLTFPLSTATISGSVKNNTNGPIVGVTLDASVSPSGQYDPGCITTDANGNYVIKVLAGNWTITVRTNDSQNQGLNQLGYSGVASQTVGVAAGGNATANFVAQPLPKLMISPSSLPSAMQGTAYNQSITASGGTAPYNYFFINGWLPSGLSLNQSSGLISGTPGESGAFSFNVGVSDANFNGTNQNYVLQVASGSFQPPSVTNLSILTNHEFHFQLAGVPGQVYAVEFSTDLKKWSPAGSLPVNANLTDLIDNDHPITNYAGLFYRLRIGRIFKTDLDFIFGASPSGTLVVGAPSQFPFPASVASYSANLSVQEDPIFPLPANVLFTGPAGSGYSGSSADPGNSSLGNENSTYESPITFTAPPALGGGWTISYHGTNLSITVPDPQPQSRLAIPIPTVTVNNNLLTSVSWTYYDSSGNALALAPGYVSTFQLQVNDQSLGRVYNSPDLPASTTSHTLSQSVTWSTVSSLGMTYNDTLGNNYVISFNQPGK